VTVSAASTVLIWTIVTIAAAGVVCVVLLRRWAARVLVAAVAAMICLAAFAIREQVTAMPAEVPGALCADGVSWFGLHLTESDEFCARYR
jgi:hypothetical protein